LARRRKTRLLCSHCGRRITSREYIGASLDFRYLFFRCRRCGLIMELKSEEFDGDLG